MLKKGVHIDRANIIGIEGIQIGKGTIVQKGATITVAEMGVGHRLASKDKKDKDVIVIGEGCRILSGAIFAASGGHIKLGNNVSVNPYTILYGHGGICVGDNTRIAAHTVIVASEHRFEDPHKLIDEQGITAQGIDIGCVVWIGTGVRILDGVKVGNGAVVGAGSVITKDVSPYDIVVGVPSRKIGSRLNANP